MVERNQFTVHSSRFTVNEPASQRLKPQALSGRDGPRYGGRLAYNPHFDIDACRELQLLKGKIPQEEYQRRKDQLDLRIRHNLETNLGERFQVELSQVTYQLVNGRLKSDEHDEPFLEIVKHGQRYRQENGSGDIEREMAEVAGFERVSQILTDPDFTDAKIIVISPRGNQDSIYQHNFFDIYQAFAEDEDGPRSIRSIVTMTRYASNATYEEFRQAAEQIDPFNNLPQDPTDADFLKTPLITYQESAGIAKIMHQDEKAMTRKDLQKLITKVTPLIDAYIKTPSLKTYNAILNFADAIIFAESDTDKYRVLQSLQNPALTCTEGLIHLYGNLPVRPVAAGCGLQGGFGQSASLTLVNSPFSVSEFGAKTSSFEDQYGTLEIHCEECGATYNRTPGQLEKNCRHCGGTRGITC